MQTGFTVIPILTFLNGQPWNEVSQSFVAAMRPTGVRMATDQITTDAVVWRITVYLTEMTLNIIRIEQEVAIPLPEGVENGYSLRAMVGLA